MNNEGIENLNSFIHHKNYVSNRELASEAPQVSCPDTSKPFGLLRDLVDGVGMCHDRIITTTVKPIDLHS